MMLGDLNREGRDGIALEEETLVSEASCRITSLSFPSGAVVEQDSVDAVSCRGSRDGRVGTAFAVELEGGVDAGVDGRVVISTGGDTEAMAVEIGSRSFFSFIFITMRSKPDDVICFSFPRPRLTIESSRTTAGL